MKSFLFNCLISRNYDLKEEPTADTNTVYIGKRVYQKDTLLEEIEGVARLILTEWCNVQSIALYNIVLPHEEILYSRKMINMLCSTALESLDVVQSLPRKERYKKMILQQLAAFPSAVVNINMLNSEFILKVVAMGNNCENPIYQYFHAFLETQYYMLVLFEKCDGADNFFEKQLTQVIRNLVIISKNKFKRKGETIFVCPCMKEFWLSIYSLCKDTCGTKQFWVIFHKLLDGEEPALSLYLLKSIAELQGVSDDTDANTDFHHLTNYELLLKKLKELLVDADDETLTRTLKNICSLMDDTWSKHVTMEAYQILWDHYSKRLNVSCKDYQSLNAISFYELVEKILSNPETCDESFEIFIGLLCSHLKKNPLQWGKIKGRIYSQLGPNKIKEMNLIGFIHVNLLFICLSSIYFEELQKKILSCLQFYPAEKNLNLVWNIYTAFILKQVKEGHSLEYSHQPLLKMLNSTACSTLKDFHLLKEFIINFEHMLNLSQNMQQKQWLLLDFWIEKYLHSSYNHGDSKQILKLILKTLQKVDTPDNWPHWEVCFKSHIYSALVSLSNLKNPPSLIGDIAGRLVVLIPQMSAEIMEVFNGNTMSPNVTYRFLVGVLNTNFLLTPNQDRLVIQSWFKICLLSLESKDELTNIVLKFDLFPKSLKLHMLGTEDPVRGLIEYFGREVRLNAESGNIHKLCDMTFGHSSKWLHCFVAEPENEAVVLRVYMYMSLAFYHCGSLIYQNSKSSCPAVRILQTLYFSNEFLVGKPPHPFILSAIKKSWELLFEALVRLNETSDNFLERTLKDMIVRYVPYFPTNDSPITSCLEKTKISSSVILDKICVSYLKHPVRENNENVLKVLKILSDVILKSTSVALLQLISSKIVFGLFELVIFHNQRHNALNVIKTLIDSPLYPDIKKDFIHAVLMITEKHLAFNTVNYFLLMYKLAEYIPSDINNILNNIEQQVKEVERKRGVGFDHNLRLQFEKLVSSLKGDA